MGLTFCSLRTSENVLLWQKERDRILKEHTAKIEALEKRLTEEKSQREQLRHRADEHTNDLKMEKLKAEITRKRSMANLPAGRIAGSVDSGGRGSDHSGSDGGNNGSDGSFYI